MIDTLFLRLLRGDLPAWIIYEDNHTFAFLDINPVNKGHVLVVPQEVFANIYDISEESWLALMKATRRIAPAIKKATNADGLNIIMNNEPAAGQLIVDHAHIHVIPRFNNDGHKNWHGKKEYTGGPEKDLMAKKIMRELELEDKE
jgi:histidine triad (HIT) family protein